MAKYRVRVQSEIYIDVEVEATNANIAKTAALTKATDFPPEYWTGVDGTIVAVETEKVK